MRTLQLLITTHCLQIPWLDEFLKLTGIHFDK